MRIVYTKYLIPKNGSIRSFCILNAFFSLLWTVKNKIISISHSFQAPFIHCERKKNFNQFIHHSKSFIFNTFMYLIYFTFLCIEWFPELRRKKRKNARPHKKIDHMSIYIVKRISSAFHNYVYQNDSLEFCFFFSLSLLFVLIPYCILISKVHSFMRGIPSAYHIFHLLLASDQCKIEI